MVPKNKKRTGVRFPARRETPLIIAGIGILLCVIVLTTYFPMIRKGHDDAYVKELEMRLLAIEEQLQALELNSSRLKQIELQSGKVDTFLDNYERLEATVTLKTNLLAGRLDSMQDQIKEIRVSGQKNVYFASKKTTVEKTKGKKKVTKQVTKDEKSKKKTVEKYHTVQKGDTFYSISRKYDITLKKLKEINGFSVKTTIYPGQKIMVRR